MKLGNHSPNPASAYLYVTCWSCLTSVLGLLLETGAIRVVWHSIYDLFCKLLDVFLERNWHSETKGIRVGPVAQRRVHLQRQSHLGVRLTITPRRSPSTTITPRQSHLDNHTSTITPCASASFSPPSFLTTCPPSFLTTSASPSSSPHGKHPNTCDGATPPARSKSFGHRLRRSGLRDRFYRFRRRRY